MTKLICSIFTVLAVKTKTYPQSLTIQFCAMLISVLLTLTSLSGAAQTPEAKQAYEKALEIRRDKNKWEEVKSLLKKAITLSPTYSKPYLLLASMEHVVYNNTEYAIGLMKTLVNLNSADASPLAYLAEIYEDQGKNELAMDVYNKAIRLDSPKTRYIFSRVSLYIKMKQVDDAIKDYGLIIQVDPNELDAYRGRAYYYMEKKQFHLAVIDYLEAIKRLPNQEIIRPTDIDKIALYFHLERAYLGNGQKDLALKARQEGAVGKGAEALNHRGSLYRREKEYDLAVLDYSAAIKIDPKDKYYSNRGKLYQRMKKFEPAIADFNQMILLDPKNQHAFSFRAECRLEMGDYQQALNDFETAMYLGSKDNFPAMTTMAIRLGNFDKAKVYADKIVDIDIYPSNPDFVKSYVNAIASFLQKENYNEVLNKLDISISKYVGEKNSQIYADVLALKGLVLGKLLRYQDALQIYEQTLLINPRQPDVVAAIQKIKTQMTVLANQDKTMPVIDLISPNSSRGLHVVAVGTKTEIIGRAKDLSGIAAVKINGSPVSSVEEDGLFISSVVLKPGANTIVIAATDKKGNTAIKNFLVTGTSATPESIAQKNDTAVVTPVTNGKQPVFHALLIAADDYEDPSIQDLENPVNDAKELETILQSNYTFDKGHIDTLYNKSREEIMQALVQKSSSMGENDNLLVFYAGHGIAEKDRFGDVDGYWIPSSAKKGLNASYISADDINKALKRSIARHILVIADACFSGAFTRSLSDASIGIQKQYSVPSRKIMASGNMEPVPDKSKFIFYLKRNLKENAAKYLTAKQLFDGFYEAILNNSETSPQYAAIKNVGDEGGQFVFIKR